MTYISLFFLPFLKTNKGDKQIHGPLPLPCIPSDTLLCEREYNYSSSGLMRYRLVKNDATKASAVTTHTKANGLLVSRDKVKSVVITDTIVNCMDK
jgi:hypothetical protein